MPRAASKASDIKIEEINAKIAKKKDEIKTLEAKRQVLENSRQAELAAKIIKIADDKGVTVEELLQTVEKK